MLLEHIRGSEDPDSTLYRQLEQYVLDHYPNPTRRDCLSSETLRLIVNELETLDLQTPSSNTSWNAQNVCAR